MLISTKDILFASTWYDECVRLRVLFTVQSVSSKFGGNVLTDGSRIHPQSPLHFA